MIFNSGPLLAVIIVDMVALLMYNFSGMCVTGEQPLSSHHTAHQPYAISCMSQIRGSAGRRTSHVQVGSAADALQRCWPSSIQ